MKVTDVKIFKREDGEAFLGSASVVLDDVYGTKSDKFGLKGQLLHSKTLGFVHPATSQYMEFDSELPDYFIKVLNKIKL
jgi:23S rRNA pseudouridine1911/1915/1917 synthase